MPDLPFPLTPLEQKAKTHAILCTTGFLILLPIGVLVARFTRTFTNRWWTAHWIIQLAVSGPVIFAGWTMGYQTTNALRIATKVVDCALVLDHTIGRLRASHLCRMDDGSPNNKGHFIDTHQKIGLALLALYVVQLVLGILIHYFKFPSLFRGRRPPQNYLHVFLGLVILILAAYQVHYGLYNEWDFALDDLHHVPQSAKNAWLALIVVFWVLYVIGMAFIPRQMRQERPTTVGKNDYDNVPLHGSQRASTE